MPLAQANRVRFDDLKSADHSVVGSAYTEVGSIFAAPARMIKITNSTDKPVLISFDGENDHDIILAGQFSIYPYCANTSESGGLLEQPQGTQVYVKEFGSAPTSGDVWVTVIFATSKN